MKLTAKQIFIMGLLVKYYLETGKGLNAYEFIKLFKKELEEQKIDTVKINSVNATLASLATKELVIKARVAYNEKMATCYTPNDKGVEILNKVNEVKEEN